MRRDSGTKARTSHLDLAFRATYAPFFHVTHDEAVLEDVILVALIATVQ